MKSRTDGAGTNWALDSNTITVFIPMTWKRRSGQKVIIAPNGSDAWAPAKARPDEALIRALARAHRWKRMLEAGKCRSIAEIAEAEKIDRAYVFPAAAAHPAGAGYPRGDPRRVAAKEHAAGGTDTGDGERVGRAAREL